MKLLFHSFDKPIQKCISFFDDSILPSFENQNKKNMFFYDDFSVTQSEVCPVTEHTL